MFSNQYLQKKNFSNQNSKDRKKMRDNFNSNSKKKFLRVS